MSGEDAVIEPIRIAQVVPPIERVPPEGYGGTERVVFELVSELARRGHRVTTFASGDSDVPGDLVATIPRALRPAGHGGDVGGFMITTMLQVLDRERQFDLIHSHLEWYSVILQRATSRPFVATFHGRLDTPWSRDSFAGRPTGMVAISESQASVHPDVPWTIVHNGLNLTGAPFQDRRSEALCYVGRIDPEKGAVEAIDVATRAGRKLRIAAKVGNLPAQRAYFEDVFRPILARAGSDVEYLGELSPADRDHLFADSYATVMAGAWPEPFGLVSIESLACGTPILARRVGALPEIIREGVDGFFGDDAMAIAFQADRIADLDRAAIRARVIEQFSAARMTDRYEVLYARLLGDRASGGDREDAASGHDGGEHAPVAGDVADVGAR